MKNFEIKSVVGSQYRMRIHSCSGIQISAIIQIEIIICHGWFHGTVAQGSN